MPSPACRASVRRRARVRGRHTARLGEGALVEQVQPGCLLFTEGGLGERCARESVLAAPDFEGAPAGAGGEGLAGLGVGVRAPGRVRGFDIGARQGFGEALLGLGAGRGPVVTVHDTGVGGQRSVRLQPAELGAGFERDVLQLGTGESGLDLRVADSAGFGEPLLPPAPPGPLPQRKSLRPRSRSVEVWTSP